MKTERKERKRQADPVVPRLWHGPDTVVPPEFRKQGIDPAKYGIDPAKVAKFQTFKNAS